MQGGGGIKTRPTAPTLEAVAREAECLARDRQPGRQRLPQGQPRRRDGGERGHREAQLRAEPRRPLAGQPHLGRDRADRPRRHDAFFGDPYFAAIVQGITRRLDESDYLLNLLVASTDPGHKTMRYLRSGVVDGAPRRLAPRGRRPAARGRHAAPARLRRPPVRSPATTSSSTSTTSRAARSARSTSSTWAGTRIGTIDRPARHARRRRPPRGLPSRHGRGRPADRRRRDRATSRRPARVAAMRRAARPRPRPRRHLRRERPHGHRGARRCCASAAIACPATSRWSASTTAPPRPRRRSR